jgi:hypothetical protein
MEFTLKRNRYSLTKEQVEKVMEEVSPEEVREHGVEINGIVFPVKQVLSISLGLPRLDFTSMDARNILSRLGFSFRNTVSPSEQIQISKKRNLRRYELIGFNVLKIADTNPNFKESLKDCLNGCRLTPQDSHLFELPKGSTLKDLIR